MRDTYHHRKTVTSRPTKNYYHQETLYGETDQEIKKLPQYKKQNV